MNLRRHQKVIIYRLKRNNGEAVVLHKAPSLTPNYTTGAVTAVANDSVSIKRAIILNERSSRDFVYDLAFIAANKNFTQGGYFDERTFRGLIDKSDLGSVTITMNDYIVWDSRRLDVRNIGESRYIYDLVLKEVDSTETAT